MFGLSTNERLILKLEERANKLEAENNNLANIIKNYDNKIERENRDAEFVIDWKKLNPFAIERIHHSSGGPKTIIGYFINEGDKQVVKEWNLYCSIERHNELAAQFKEYINART